MDVIKVQPAEDLVILTWTLTARCNYDCMYCPPEFHDSTSVTPDLETLQKSWLSFYEKTQHKNLPYKIAFTGGEPTVVKAFLPFVTWLKQQPFGVKQIVTTTNGSASLNYYVKISQFVDSLSFSTHSEHINEQEFFDKVFAVNKIMIRPEKSAHVNIMDEWWNQDRVALYRQWCQKHQISHSVNRVDYSEQTRTIPIMKGVLNLAA